MQAEQAVPTPDLSALASLILVSPSFCKPLFAVNELNRSFSHISVTFDTRECGVSGFLEVLALGRCPEVSVKIWLQRESRHLSQLDTCNSFITSCSPTSFSVTFCTAFAFSSFSWLTFLSFFLGMSFRDCICLFFAPASPPPPFVTAGEAFSWLSSLICVLHSPFPNLAQVHCLLANF